MEEHVQYITYEELSQPQETTLQEAVNLLNNPETWKHQFVSMDKFRQCIKFSSNIQEIQMVLTDNILKIQQMIDDLRSHSSKNGLIMIKEAMLKVEYAQVLLDPLLLPLCRKAICDKKFLAKEAQEAVKNLINNCATVELLLKLSLLLEEQQKSYQLVMFIANSLLDGVKKTQKPVLNVLELQPQILQIVLNNSDGKCKKPLNDIIQFVRQDWQHFCQTQQISQQEQVSESLRTHPALQTLNQQQVEKIVGQQKKQANKVDWKKVKVEKITEKRKSIEPEEEIAIFQPRKSSELNTNLKVNPFEGQQERENTEESKKEIS